MANFEAKNAVKLGEKHAKRTNDSICTHVNPDPPTLGFFFGRKQGKPNQKSKGFSLFEAKNSLERKEERTKQARKIGK